MSHHEKTQNVRLWTTPAPWPRGRHPDDPAQALRAMAAALDGEPPCAVDPDRWFSGAQADIEAAQAVCRACPALQPCGALAAALGEVFGTWGAVDRSSPRARQRADASPAPTTDTTTEESA